jgi:hypothetical protein
MTRKGRLEALIAFEARHPSAAGVGSDGEVAVDKEATWTGRLPEWLDESKTAPTLLHLASQHDQAEVVRWLLFEKRADPTVAAGGPKTPYELASSRTTRNVFRRCFAEHGDWWAWEVEARVPSALTEEQESEQKSKNKDRKGRLREKMAERQREKEVQAELEAAKEAEEAAKREEVERKKRESESPLSRRGPQRLGGGPPRALGSAAARVDEAGLSEEARRRIERERRARAAEARLRANG